MEDEKNLDEYNNKCTLSYKVNSYDEKIKIFDKKFCQNNFQNCLIIIEGQKQTIFDYYQNINLEKNITIELLIGNNVTDYSYMFNGCSSLSSITFNSNWNTNKVTNMKWMFFGCSSLESLPDMSKWNISNVSDIQFMFARCKSLKMLPDISKWDTGNITNMSCSFSECSSLKSLPDISKWNISNVINLNKLFSACINLLSLPDISKWNTSKLENMSYIFDECILLSSLPDISKWNTSNVKNMSNMFSKCKTLKSLPDISKWDTENVKDISLIFSECIFLSSLPDISKWNTKNILFMNGIFKKCHLLESLPDISKWDTTKVTNMNYMFSECSSLKKLPDISKWNASSVMEMVNMFSDCSSLESIPDISKWDLSNVTNNNNMFQGCRHDFLKEKIFCDDYDDKNKYELNIKVDKNNIIRNDDLKFFPQVELKFNNIDNITKIMIDNIKAEIRQLLNNDNFSIIEIKKGSLIVILSLQFIIFDEIKKKKESILEFNFDEFLNEFSDNIKQEVKKTATILQNHEFLSLGSVKPDYVDEDIVDITDRNNRDELEIKIKSISSEKNDINLYEISNIKELEIFFTKKLQDAEIQEKNQFKILKDLEEFNDLFDFEIEGALKKAYFEFKIVHIFLVDRENRITYIKKDNAIIELLKYYFMAHN